MLKRNKKILQLFFQFAKFGIVGITNTAISLIIYYILINLKINYIAANTSGFFVSIVNSFYWNNKYVFTHRKSPIQHAFLRVFISYGFTFVISTFLLFLMVQYIGISKNIAPLFNLLITIPLNFCLNKYWAMR